MSVMEKTTKRKGSRPNWYNKLKQDAATGDKAAVEKFAAYRRLQATKMREHYQRKKAEQQAAGGNAGGDNKVMHFPLHAIPERPAAKRKSPPPLPRVRDESSRAMRVVVKAGSEITVTVGGIEVRIVAEG